GLHPYHLSTVEFYELCRARLRPGGVVTTNLSVIDPLLPAKVATFAAAFPAAYAYDASGACVLFGTDTTRTPTQVLHAARAVAHRYGFSFPMAEYAAGLTPLRPDPDIRLLHDTGA